MHIFAEVSDEASNLLTRPLHRPVLDLVRSQAALPVKLAVNKKPLVRRSIAMRRQAPVAKKLVLLNAPLVDPQIPTAPSPQSSLAVHLVRLPVAIVVPAGIRPTTQQDPLPLSEAVPELPTKSRVLRDEAAMAVHAPILPFPAVHARSALWGFAPELTMAMDLAAHELPFVEISVREAHCAVSVGSRRAVIKA